MRRRGDTLLRILGLVLGLVAASALVLTSRIPPGTGVLGADVIVASGPTGELGVTPAGPFLSATNLAPSTGGDVPTGTLSLTNQTGSGLDVQIRGLPSNTDMDELLHVRVMADGSPLFDGMLGDLRSWTVRALPISSGATSDLQVATWLAPPQGAAWSGRVANVFLEFRSTVEGTT